LKAIQDLVKKVDALANDFFAGNVDQALSKAADLDIDTDQLANVALRLSMKLSSSSAAASGCQSPQPAPSSPAPETPISAEGSVLDAATEAAPVDTSVATSPARDAAPAEPAGETPAAEPLPTPQMMIAKFVASVLATFQPSGSDGESRVTMSFKMKLELLTAAIEAKQVDESAESKAGMKKLCEVVEAGATASS
jgi:hypothetical protein